MRQRYDQLFQEMADVPFARPSRMFYLLLPASICCGTLIASAIIASYHQDDRNLGGACVLVFLTPVALVSVVVAIVQANMLENGQAALVQGALWNLLVVAAIAVPIFMLAK